jgi:hypothetical protein
MEPAKIVLSCVQHAMYEMDRYLRDCPRLVNEILGNIEAVWGIAKPYTHSMVDGVHSSIQHRVLTL